VRLPFVSVLVVTLPAARTLLLASLLLVGLGGCASRRTSAPRAADHYDSAAAPLLAVPLRLDKGWRDSGVQELAGAIGDARVVMLGEPWHGDGGAIRVRSELVRLLHERMGFDVLALEADFYSLQRGWEAVRTGGDIRAMARENVWHFWSISRAAEPLWRYIEAQHGTDRPLHVAGVDTRHVGALARATLPAELDQRLADLAGVSSEERTRFRTTLERLLIDELRYRPPAGEQEAFFAVLDRLSAALNARDSAGREPFWEHEVRNLRNAALFAWRGASRDHAMGENLAWLATHAYPGRKIILWAHNNHIITDKWMYFSSDDTLAVTRKVAQRNLETIARITYLGHEARQFFGPNVFSLAVLSYSGTYSPDVRTENLRQYGNFDSLAVLSPAPEGTIEAMLANAGHEIAFVDLRRVAPASWPARALDYVRLPPMRLRWHEGFDGFLFIRSTFGLNEEPPADWVGRGAR
jgi:erythromycin esterase-like protein